MIFKTHPWAHQRAAYDKLAGVEYGALLMEMGCGKSKTAIDLAYGHYQAGRIDRVLLICPSALKDQWKDQQLPTHHPGAFGAVVWDAVKAGSAKAKAERKAVLWDEPEGLKWFIVNVEAFSTKTYLPIFLNYVKSRPCMVIIDEATRIKNPGAKRTSAIRELGKLAAVRLILTGSLITGSPYDAWAPFEFLKDGYWGMSFFAFRSRYGIEAMRENPFGGKYRKPINAGEMKKIRAQVSKYGVSQAAVFNGMSEADVRYLVEHTELAVPYKNLAELKEKIDAISVQVRKEDALDIPPKVYSTLTVDMTKEQRRVYKELKEQLLAEHQGQELTVANKLSLVTRLQQIAGGFFPNNEGQPPITIEGGNPKLDALIEALEDNPGTPVVIWARFVAEIKALGQEIAKVLSDRTVEVYHGGVIQDERARIVSDFQDGICDTLIANPATAGYGLNLQVAHTVFYFSSDFSLENRVQSEDRVHRAGQKVGCSYTDIIAKGTVDEGVRDALMKKSSLADYFASHTLAEFLG